MAKGIRGAGKFVLQQFDPRNTLDPALGGVAPYQAEKLQEMAAIAGRYVKSVLVRGK
ncbi:MAG: hypothetical protein KKD13_00655 [Candidatus Margulisbacteria bacterium]|nr:hypothetical protein [Candidatus Margulisiibacteriota bacterium]